MVPDGFKARAELILREPQNSVDFNLYRSLVGRSDSDHGTVFRFQFGPADQVYRTSEPIHRDSPPLLSKLLAILPCVPESALSLRALAAMLDEDVHQLRHAVATAPPGRIAIAAMEDLAGKISPYEISRWAAQGMDVDRVYWQNVRDADRYLNSLDWTENLSYLHVLKMSHVIYLMGLGLNSCYFPTSPARRIMATDPTVGPGTLRRSLVHCSGKTPREMRYYEELMEGTGGNYARFDETGTFWGQARWEWYPGGLGRRHPLHIFCPPEAILPAHVQCLESAWTDVVKSLHRGAGDDLVEATGRLFYYTVCLHPFYCGNMGLVMLVINHVMKKGIRACIPHLHLDWCAHRLDLCRFSKFWRSMCDEYMLPIAEPENTGKMTEKIELLKQRESGGT